MEPISGESLSMENISVMIRNYGSASQSNFDVSYQVDADSPVSESVAGPLNSLDSVEYTFTTQVDLSQFGEYSIQAYTSLPDDTDLSNDTSLAIVENSICMPAANCAVGDGLRLVQLTTLINPSGCSPDGYGDFTDMSTELSQGSTQNITLSTEYGNQYVNVWIDLNDNFLFENEEIIVDNFILGEGQNSGSYTDSTEFIIDESANLGDHLMRVKSNWNSPVSENACQGSSYGETEDYTATITLIDAIDESGLEPNDLMVRYLPNNHFEVSFEALYTQEPLIINVHNTAGQCVISNRVSSINGTYFYDFDMSYAAPGVYLVRLGSDTFGKVRKIVVK
jgi:hypothetical protein